MSIEEPNNDISTIASVIQIVESNGNKNAIRYEPNWRWSTAENIFNCAKAHRCSTATAKIILATSFGKYQIMGEVLYELGFTGRLIPDFLNNEPLQDIYFGKYIISRHCPTTLKELQTPEGRKDFASKYNGPGAVDDYADNIEHAMKFLNLLEV